MVVKAYLTILLNQELVYAADSTLAEAQSSVFTGAGAIPGGGRCYRSGLHAAIGGRGGFSGPHTSQNVNFQNSKVSLLYLLNVPPDQFSNYSFLMPMASIQLPLRQPRGGRYLYSTWKRSMLLSTNALTFSPRKKASKLLRMSSM